MSALAGRRVLVLRASQQASALLERLRQYEAIPLPLPTIAIGAPSRWDGMDSALRSLASFDLLVFTSANAVRAFQRRCAYLGIEPGARHVAVVGPSTASEAEAAGLVVDRVPHPFTAQALAATLAPEARGRRFLLLLAEGAPSTLQHGLLAAGGEVEVARAYSLQIPPEARDGLAQALAPEAPSLDAVAFTSASIARNLRLLLDAANLALPERVCRASIGPVTSRELQELGMAAHIEAAEATIAALVNALERYFSESAAVQVS